MSLPAAFHERVAPRRQAPQGTATNFQRHHHHDGGSHDSGGHGAPLDAAASGGSAGSASDDVAGLFPELQLSDESQWRNIMDAAGEDLGPWVALLASSSRAGALPGGILDGRRDLKGRWDEQHGHVAAGGGTTAGAGAPGRGQRPSDDGAVCRDQQDQGEWHGGPVAAGGQGSGAPVAGCGLQGPLLALLVLLGACRDDEEARQHAVEAGALPALVAILQQVRWDAAVRRCGAPTPSPAVALCHCHTG